MKEHKNNALLRALADGKSIQTKYFTSDDDCWEPLIGNADAMKDFLEGDHSSWEFRVMRETLDINISSTQVITIQSPIRVAPAEGTIVWHLDMHGTPRKFDFGNSGYCNNHLMMEKGFLFETKKDALLWEDTRRKLMKVA